MAYATEKVKVTREPLTIVEIDLDYCSLTFGVPPCTAVGATGTECYNTRKTCQAVASYTPAPKTYRFVEQRANLPAALDYYPCLISATRLPNKITPGQGLGRLGTVTATLQDFSHHDRGVDKYATTRAYVANDRGTFFGKLKHRNEYYAGRIMRVKTGYLTTPFDLASNFKTRTYIIDKITGPDRAGKVQIVGIDLLAKALDRRSVAPVQTTGTVATALTIGETSTLVLSTGSGSQYPASNGTIRIDSELITYTSRSTDTLSSLTRGVGGTTVAAHNVGAAVQKVLVYSAVNVVTIINDLLTTYAGISSSYINSADWTAEQAAWLSSYNLTSYISKPTGVAELISELCTQSLVDIWWDDETAKIKLKAFAPYQSNASPPSLTDASHIIMDSVSVEDLPDQRLTRVSVLYGVRNYVSDLDKDDNYEREQRSIDVDAESSVQFNDVRIKKIFSRWFTSGQEGLALTLAGRLLGRFRATPVRLKLSVDVKDDTIYAGDIVEITTRKLQDEDGAAIAAQFQIVELAETVGGHRIDLVLLSANFTGLYAFIGPNTLLNFTAETAANKRRYAFISDNNGLMSDGSPGYKIV